MADEVWVDVLPALDGFGAQMFKGVTKASKEAGARSGKEYSAAFKDGAGGASDAAIKELETAEKRAAGLVQKLAGDMSRSRQAQQRSAADLLIAEQRLIDAVAKYGENSAQAQAAALRSSAARDKARDAANKLQSAEEALKQGQKSHTTITEQLTAAQSKLAGEVKQAPGLWGKFTSAMGTAKDKVKSFADSAGGMVTQIGGAVGGVALLKEAFGQSLDKETFVDKLNATLAATPEQSATYGAAAGNLYKRGFGEGMEDITSSVDAVVSSMGGLRNASTADIEKITGYALNLSKAFDVDVSEAAATAGVMMKNGLAADGVQAMDLITGAMSKVPKQVRGEVLPVMTEYGKHFAALGIDGETAMGMIAAGAQDGAIGMDKVGDSLKEFTIRGTDMSKTTTEAYKTLGLNSQEMTNELLAGGDRAETAMGKIVHGLQSIDDPGQQAAASLALFGTPLEDLGTDQIPNFLGMIDPMGDAFDSTAGAADKLSGTLNDNTSASLETLKRSFTTMLTDGIQPALKPLNNVLTWATNTPGVMTAVAVALGVVAGAWVAVTLAASPWLAIGVGIAVVIAGIVLAVKNWGAIMQWGKDVVGKALGWIGDRWRTFTGWWKDGTSKIGTQWRDLWGGAKNFVTERFSATTGWINTKLGGFRGWWNEGTGKIGSQWRDLWGGAKTFVTERFSATTGWIGGKLGSFKSTWQSSLNNVKGFWGDTWNGIKTKVSDVWNRGIKPVFDVISKVLKGDFVGAFRSAKDSVDKLWRGVANVVRKPINFVIGSVYNRGIRNVFNKVASLVGIGQLGEAAEIPAFAKGGYHKGGWAMVGEEGPELVNFQGPGQVYTAQESKRMIAQNGRKARPDEQLLQAAAGPTPAQTKLPMGGFWDDPFGGIRGAVSGVITKGIDWVRGGLAKAAETVVQPIKNGLSAALGNQGFGLMISKTAAKILDGAVGWLRGKDNQANKEMAAGGSAAIFDGPLGSAHRPSRGPFTSGYGPRWGSFHAGVDIAGGGPTYAYQNGVVQKTGWNIGPGRTGVGILINHGSGLWTYYGHNPVGGVQVKPGQQVKGGQHIGYQGATGNVTGVHTHFEVHKGRPWANVNPMPYLYDGGGILQPGFTPVLNNTNEPEKIYTGPQDRALQALARRGAEQVEGGGDISIGQIIIPVDDLAELKEVTDFIESLRRRARQK